MLGKIEGVITEWNSETEFGCIKDKNGKTIFFNLHEYRPPKKPELHEEVVFVLSQDSKGRLQAFDIQELAFVRQQKQIENAQNDEGNQQGLAIAINAEQLNLILVGLLAVLGLGLMLFYL